MLKLKICLYFVLDCPQSWNYNLCTGKTSNNAPDPIWIQTIWNICMLLIWLHLEYTAHKYYRRDPKMLARLINVELFFQFDPMPHDALMMWCDKNTNQCVLVRSMHRLWLCTNSTQIWGCKMRDISGREQMTQLTELTSLSIMIPLVIWV